MPAMSKAYADLAPSREDIEEARVVIDGLVHRTPLLSSRSVGERTGCEVWLKAENLQKTGSFKARGAFNKVLHLPPAERERGIVTASAGNHGQAVAFVARHLSIPGFVVMPEGANASKVAAVRAYGATAILHGEVWDDAFARSMELAKERGLTYVHPFKDRKVMAGQATIALEIAEDLPDVAAVVVPIGGGGLISGIGTAFSLHHPKVRVIGVEAEGSPNMERSRREGRAVVLPRVDTIADGLATRSTDPDVFEIVERVVHDLVTVTDDEIREAILFLLERAKLLAEPAGAAAVAALIKGKISLPKEAKCVALVCGGNFDVAGKLSLRI
jgi:threonine dehydratase